MSDPIFQQGLWAPRSAEDTLKLYAEWADSYEADTRAAGYATPDRLADALAAHLPDKNAAILDFGCGTGMSGDALAAQGFTTIDGTDITPEMLTYARAKKIYRTLTKGAVGEMPLVSPGDYAAITACGVVSLGAAPPELLTSLLNLLAPKGLLVFSYNEATLVSAPYQTALAEVQSSGLARLRWAELGDHLPHKPGAQTSIVYILERL